MNLDLLYNLTKVTVFICLAEEKVGKSKFAMNMLEYMVDTYKEDGVLSALK